MLPSVLQSSYKTYKEDTNTIATWLATKAKQCGYSADLLDRDGSSNSSKATQAPKRLKGKARKKAQDASKGTTSSSEASATKADNAEPPTYVIKVKEFISLADYIVGSSKPLVKVPAALIRVLDRAIKLRKESGWAAGQSGKSDEGHAHFLGILEKTRELLKPRSPAETEDDSPTKPNADGEASEAKEHEEIANIFASLDIEEPSQEFLDAPDVKPAPIERKPKYEVETLQTREEEYLAAHCLLVDVRNIRHFLCALWKNYQDGMDLCAVSVTVNTAIDFVRTLEQDLVRRFPDKTDYESITMIFYIAQCVHRGQNPSHKQQQGDLFNMVVYDLAEDIMLPTCSILSSLQDVIQDGTVPQYKPGFLGFRDRRTHWHDKSPRDQIQDDRLLLMEAFPDLVLMSMITSRMPLAEDELMRGIRQMAPGKNIPLWLVFAVQCFLDAQHELKSGISKAHDQLQNDAKSIRGSIDQNLKFHKKLRIVNWPKENDERFTETMYVIDEWIVKDVVAEKWRKVARQHSIPPVEPFVLLKQYPVICGLFSFALKMRYQELQVAFINAWGSIMYTGQLYNAVRQEKIFEEKLLPSIWHDMELAVALQGPNKFFVGDTPKEMEDYLKRFLLSVGYSAALFANNRRKNINAVSVKGPRQLTPLCAVGKLFAGRYCNNDTAVSWTTESIKPIIEAKYEENSDAEEATQATPPPEEKDDNLTSRSKKKATVKTPKTTRPKQSSSGTLLRRHSRSTTSIPTTAFLLDLANALHAERVELNTDYLRIHRFCWTMLRRVHEACKPRLLETYGGGYLEREDQLPFVVGYIFMSASATAEIAGLLIKKKDGVETSNKLLMRAADVMGEMIGEGKGAEETRVLEGKMGVKVDFGEELGFS